MLVSNVIKQAGDSEDIYKMAIRYYFSHLRAWLVESPNLKKNRTVQNYLLLYERQAVTFMGLIRSAGRQEMRLPERYWRSDKMDLVTCLKKMKLVGVLAFATVDSEGAPQIRNISAIHYEPDALYFFTARGKNFCQELMEDGRVQILAYTKYKEMIRLSGKAYAVAENEQKKWMDIIFEEQPYLANVYPGDTREIGIIFRIDKAEVEYFNLGVNPIFRETYILGNVSIKEKGYYITESCIGCGTCMKHCPQKCIEKGTSFVIRQEHCLHCGNCYENCPVKAVIRK